MTDVTPPTNGRPGYKDLYDAINGLRGEFNVSLKASEDRILMELRSAEARRKEDANTIKQELAGDLEAERQAREKLSATVTEIRDWMLKAGAIFAVLLVIVNFVAPLVLERLKIV